MDAENYGEPWKYNEAAIGPELHDCFVAYDAQGQRLISAGVAIDDQPSEEAVFRRIVACVNA
jgi:hypothetical protein